MVKVTSHCQKFHWSGSALVDLISVDQLFTLDNVLSYSVFHVIEHREYMYVPLRIDTLPCDTTEDDILAALMPMGMCMYIPSCMCMCSYVHV